MKDSHPECSEHNCKRKAKYQKGGLCAPCYMRAWRYGSASYDPKAYLRSTRSPTTKELAWAAGFLEGEGCFSVRGDYHIACISASQVNPEPLQTLHSIFGGSLNERFGSHERQSDYWHWGVSGARARGVMMTLYSLLSRQKQGIIKELAKDAKWKKENNTNTQYMH